MALRRQDKHLLLWPSGAPGALGQGEQDAPSLMAWLPEAEKATGAAVVICPGGGYGWLAEHEGRDYAHFLNRAGLACFVLSYRLASRGYRHPAMLQDAARALRWVRAQAADFGVDPARVAIMGSSAGGHLASTLLTRFDKGDPDSPDPVERQSSRPDLGILCYPVVTMESFGHAGCRSNLLGDSPSAELIQLLSNEKHVGAATPPCFLWHTTEDEAVPVRNSQEFAASLQRQGVPFELHIYEKGGHGMGLGAKPPDFEGAHPWAGALLRWLRERGYAV